MRFGVQAPLPPSVLVEQYGTPFAATSLVKWISWIGGMAILALAAGWFLDVAHGCGRHARFTTIWPTRGFCRSATRPASSALKELATAEADFRKNDRDGNGKENFWRADIAGLYALAPGGGPAIKLIELSVAAADERPRIDLSSYAVRAPKAGYWYRAIRHADEDPQALDPMRFAYCAFPDSPSAGRYIFIVDENSIVYRSAANERRGIEVFPTDEELKTQWSKVD